MKEIHHSVTCCCQFGLQLSQLKVIQVCCGILSFFLNGDHACPTETWITEETEGLLSSFLFSQSANETQCNLDWMRCTYWLQVWHIFMNIYCHIYLNLIIYPLRFLQNNGWIIDLTCDHQPLILCQQSTVHIYIVNLSLTRFINTQPANTLDLTHMSLSFSLSFHTCTYSTILPE